MKTVQERARSYALKMPPSIEGSVGSNDAFNVAAVLAIGFDLADEDALRIMEEWNAGCQPPWSEKELLQKLASARRDCKRSPGYLLGEVQKPNQREAPRPPNTFTPGTITRGEAERFAKARGLPLDALRAAVSLGALRAGEHSRFGRCLAMMEGGWWQARRLDAQPFSTGRKTDSKPGTAPKFFGGSWLGDCPNVLLVEGCVGWLEAVAAILGTGQTNYAALAAYNAGASFKDDLALVTKLAGRRILICPDAGDAGISAAKKWDNELQRIGCAVQQIELPDGFADLGKFLPTPNALQFLNDELNYTPHTPKP
jgi:hypothetical protein